MKVKVKLFGLLRLDSGIKELELEGERVKDLYPQLLASIKQLKPDCALSEKELRGCVVSVNGRRAAPGTRLSPGDEICLLPPVAGG